jgi:hypothetical protein
MAPCQYVIGEPYSTVPDIMLIYSLNASILSPAQSKREPEDSRQSQPDPRATAVVVTTNLLAGKQINSAILALLSSTSKTSKPVLTLPSVAVLQ